MTSRIHRQLARSGAAALIAGALIGIAGSPARAAETADLEVTIAGTTLAATASGKVIDVTVTNHGPGLATGVIVSFDLEGLDTAKVSFDVPDEDACQADGDVVSCQLIDVAAGQALDLGFRLTSRGGAGDAGTIGAVVRHAGTDGDEAGNSVVVPVTIGDSGPDLYVYAPDVPFDPATGEPGTVAPGGTANLLYAVGNFGDVAVDGVALKITLPEHVTFVDAEPGCGYNAARSVATCTYGDMPIVAADADTVADDEIYSSIGFYNAIKVADDAPAPSNLTGGSVSVEPIVTNHPEPTVLRAAPALPANAEGGSAREVDATDNTDEFAVYVAVAAGGSGGSGSGAGGDDATLPITGARVGPVVGVGLAVLVGGGLLLLMSRRRAGAVAHDDETSAV